MEEPRACRQGTGLFEEVTTKMLYDAETRIQCAGLALAILCLLGLLWPAQARTHKSEVPQLSASPVYYDPIVMKWKNGQLVVPGWLLNVIVFLGMLLIAVFGP